MYGKFSDYGEKDNMDLAERFGVSSKKEDLPKYLLFLQGKDEPIVYTGNTVDKDEILTFIMAESGKSFLSCYCYQHKVSMCVYSTKQMCSRIY